MYYTIPCHGIFFNLDPAVTASAVNQHRKYCQYLFVCFFFFFLKRKEKKLTAMIACACGSISDSVMRNSVIVLLNR